MSKSEAQKFAQKRNSAGGLLKGIVRNLKENILPYTANVERDEIEIAISRLGGIRSHWSDNYEQAKKENL